MKTRILVATLCCIALSFGFALTSFAGAGPGTGIVDSKHDMNSYLPAPDAQNRVCAYCHTPHHALEDLDYDYLPLWSHELTSQIFTDYDSATYDGFGNMADNTFFDSLTGPSRLCMSCHDGAVAVDSYYGNTGTMAPEGDAWGEIGVGLNGDLTNDHPIGFYYDAVATADLEIKDSGQTFGGGTKLISDVLYDDGTGNGGVMTCSSCHDVHNSLGVVDSAFLYGLQADSQICLTCHDK